MKKSLTLPLLFLSLLLSYTSALLSEEEEWVVSDIRLSGLQRVSAGSVFAAIPVSVGDKVDSYKLRDMAKSLFSTGQFDDIEIGRDGNILLISLDERPSISSIDIEGNKAIKTEDLIKGLEGAGLSAGQVFKRSILNSLSLEIQSQ